MRKRREQVTCLCGAYEFPHRLGGGVCHGRTWAASYFEYEREECGLCKANAGTECEVAVGKEKIKHCEGAMDHLRAQPSLRHPLYGKRLDDYLDCSSAHRPAEEVTPYMESQEIPF